MRKEGKGDGVKSLWHWKPLDLTIENNCTNAL